MIHIVPPELLKLAGDWEAECRHRRRLSAVDPIADTLLFCAADLRERVKQAEDARRTLSTSQYARHHGVSPATVRRWIAQGKLEAHANGSGDYRIPRHAVKVRRQVHDS